MLISLHLRRIVSQVVTHKEDKICKDSKENNTEYFWFSWVANPDDTPPVSPHINNWILTFSYSEGKADVYYLVFALLVFKTLDFVSIGNTWISHAMCTLSYIKMHFSLKQKFELKWATVPRKKKPQTRKPIEGCWSTWEYWNTDAPSCGLAEIKQTKEAITV